MKDLHPATTGFSAAADAYERGRPGYPADAMAWIAERLELRPGRDVLDLAAGTGKLTRSLVPFGARVIAVEPIDEMREHLFAALPDVEAFDGTAESIPLPDGSVDAVTCGQAFHWFRVEQALREIHRVLRPGGSLALVWNIRDLSDPLQARIQEILAPHGAEVRSHRDIEPAELLAGDLFGPVEHRSWPYVQRLSRAPRRPDRLDELHRDSRSRRPRRGPEPGAGGRRRPSGADFDPVHDRRLRRRPNVKSGLDDFRDRVYLGAEVGGGAPLSQVLHETSRSRRGPDEEASRLYAEYGDKIFRYCLGQLRSREEAEDAVQNTFLRVCTALRKGVVPEFEAPWLYKIAHNVCLSRRLGSSRRARVETPADLDTLEYRAAAHTPDADELFGLDDALADMPPNLRRPLLMREWQGMSYAEIADALGVSHSAVETLIFRGRRHLAQALTDSVKKSGRAIASVFNLRWLFDALKGLGGGAGSAGMAAGAVGLVVAIGGGVAIDLATQSAAASQTKGSGATGTLVAPSRAPGAAASSAGGSSAGARSATSHVRGASPQHGGAGRSAVSGSASAGAPSTPGSSLSTAGSTSVSGTASSSRTASSSSSQSSPGKAGAGSSSQRPSPKPVPPGSRVFRAPRCPGSLGSRPGRPRAPITVPGVPDLPPVPAPPSVDPPPLPPPPVSLPPVPPVPPVPPPVPPPVLPPPPPLPPLPPLAPVAPPAHGALP